MEWTVRWSINVDAEYADEAAQRALEIMQNPASTDQYFHVAGENGETTYVDLYPYGRSTNHGVEPPAASMEGERVMDWVVAWRIKVNSETIRSTAMKVLEIMAIPNFTTAYFALVDEDGEVHEVDLRKALEEDDQ